MKNRVDLKSVKYYDHFPTGIRLYFQLVNLLEIYVHWNKDWVLKLELSRKSPAWSETSNSFEFQPTVFIRTNGDDFFWKRMVS